ncbi:hypothetical protein CEUSTIGMA_g9395.t1 [Chlamydomonas eustigma]|uniref:Uncharacterized protein n=1 Tax=Chlamydomonas eustigma TaxID=1157962 RepID=A0A250XFW9_9CHLO|nr:hypothetical protein CEUSTIGMA_g9395.t1 [Chlamydomonas eustigma]|eukprot:GAX81967.1 hypothetical protein CEUSTIGMA_g9395.t1 [Chlamydomonas eustigma]
MTSTSTGSAPTSSQPLPSKEAATFRTLVKMYESKMYKKAIKAADTILKRFPDHGETLAMKGLVINSMGGSPGSGVGNERREEAYELVRRGLKSDLKSHVCWHVYGLLYRSDREYREAIKCYLNALRLDKDNVQILRDLANLQVQMRDLAGYVDTRHTLLTLKGSNRNNWVSFAVAHHINGNHDMAVQILEAYEKTLDSSIPLSEEYEHSEMLMYKTQVLTEGGRLSDALACLDAHKDKIRDKWAYAEHRASLLLKLERRGEAVKAYRSMLALNPDHYRVHEGLQEAMGLRATPGQAPLTDSQRAELTEVYRKLQEQYPMSSACRRIPLDFTPVLHTSEAIGSADYSSCPFTACADAYVKPYLRKGVPSLFMDIRPLYKDNYKREAVQDLFQRYSTALKEKSTFSLTQAPAVNGTDSASAENAAAESPLVRVWVLYFLAQHYDYIGDFSQALSHVNEAIAHTPTLVELYNAKAKIMKHAGDTEAAAHLSEAARRSDLSDRYLNSVTVKALLNAGRPDMADLTAALFVREGEAPVASTLYDMQHMWYEVAAGACYERQGELGKALKKYIAVTKHFDDIHEDQFDFHGYCVRKMTLRAYIGMLRMEDNLYGNPYYSKAATGAVRCYLALYDKPASASAEEEDAKAMEGMSAEERKKYKLKRKKEEKQRAKEAEDKARSLEEARAAKEAASKSDSASGGSEATGKKKKEAQAAPREKDPDPDGLKLAGTEDPLGEAAKLVTMLKQHAGHRLETHTAAFEVYMRKNKLLLALSAVKRASQAAGNANPQVHVMLVRLSSAVKAANGLVSDTSSATSSSPPLPAVTAVLNEGLALLPGGVDVKTYCATWRREHGTSSLQHRAAAATASVLLNPEDKPEVLKWLMSANMSEEKPSHQDCVKIHAALIKPGSPLEDVEAASAFKTMAASAFPLSRYFGGGAPVEYEIFEFDNMIEAFGRLSF